MRYDAEHKSTIHRKIVKGAARQLKKKGHDIDGWSYCHCPHNAGSGGAAADPGFSP
jgi:hypothetical protein